MGATMPQSTGVVKSIGILVRPNQEGFGAVTGYQAREPSRRISRSDSEPFEGVIQARLYSPGGFAPTGR